MIKPGDHIKAVLFKQVPGGWVFRAPSPMIFGRREHYLVTSEQQDSIVAILTPRRPFLALGSWALACLLALAAYLTWLTFAEPDYPCTTLAIFIVAVVFASVLALHLSTKAQRHRLQPILADAPRSDERITSTDIQLALHMSLSIAQMRRIGLQSAALGAINVVCIAVMMWIAKQPADYIAIPGVAFNFIIAIQCGFSSVTFYRCAQQRELEEKGIRPRANIWHTALATIAIPACALAMLGLLCVGAWTSIDHELSDLAAGQRHAAKGQHDQAITSFSKSIVTRPGNVAAYLARAESHIAKSDRNRAIEDYAKVIELEPRNVKVLRKRADAYRVIGAIEQAISDYDRAIDLDPGNASGDRHYAYLFRAITFQNKIDHERAIADLTSAIEINPKGHLAYYFRGISYAARKQHARAIEDLSVSIQRNPSDVYAHMARARSYGAEKEHARAMADLARAIEIDPNSTTAYIQRAAAHAVAGARELAIADYRAVIALPAPSAADRQRQDTARQQLERLMATRATGQYTKLQ